MVLEVFYMKIEGLFNMFFVLLFNNECFVLDLVKCENGYCEIMGEYDGFEIELLWVIEVLE